jgi:hypothetical protein
VLLYSVIIEDYIYVRVLAGLNTGCNNNIIKTYFRGLELGLIKADFPKTLTGAKSGDDHPRR